MMSILYWPFVIKKKTTRRRKPWFHAGTRSLNPNNAQVSGEIEAGGHLHPQIPQSLIGRLKGPLPSQTFQYMSQ